MESYANTNTETQLTDTADMLSGVLHSAEETPDALMHYIATGAIAEYDNASTTNPPKLFQIQDESSLSKIRKVRTV